MRKSYISDRRIELNSGGPADENACLVNFRYFMSKKLNDLINNLIDDLLNVEIN